MKTPTSPDLGTQPAATHAVRSARDAVERGDLLLACDIAQLAQAEGRSDPELAYLHVLSLARMGASAQAFAAFERLGLAASGEVDPVALYARLLKDVALAERPWDPVKMAAAAAAYLAVYQRFGDPFPGINAASLALLAGDRTAAQDLARELLDHDRLQTPGSYYDGATRAEVHLLLGETEAAQAALAAALDLDGSNVGSWSTTRRQLRQLCRGLGLSEERSAQVLAPLQAPQVLVFTGQEFDPDEDEEAALVVQIDRALDELASRIAYGPLARGADILIAERLLERGAELNVVLPFQAQEFLRVSVGEGSPWQPRFEACMARAASVTLATQTTFVQDPLQFRFGADVAMGLALIRARHLDTDVVQLAVVEDDAQPGVCGVVRDIEAWRASGGSTLLLRACRAAALRGATDDTADHGMERGIKAIIFTDFAGFSKIAEDALPRFWREIMARIGAVLDRHGAAVVCRNSWGDAVYAVIETASVAAEVAVQLQEELAGFDMSTLGIQDQGGMRVGAHLGPVFRAHDSVTGQWNYLGSEVSRAARIEPITPPGDVYVTEAFAAVLALEDEHRFDCAYVGRLELPKKFGAQRMYRLSRASALA